MAEENKQEPTVESAPAAQETSTAIGVENNQQVQANPTASATETQPVAAKSDTPEVEEWNGNDVESLPTPLQARARGMLRYLHKVSQEASSVKQQAQAYNELLNKPEYQEFVKWKESQSISSTPSTQLAPQVPELAPITEDEFLAAQTDPAKFVEVQNKILMQQAQPVLQELQQLKQIVNELKQDKAQAEARNHLETFAQVHPDLWEINPVIMKASLEEIVQKKGGTLEDAYQHAKSLEKQYLEKAHSTIKQTVEAKKKAVSASPSKSMEPEIIYATNSREATKIAFENAKVGKQVDVRVKSK